LLSSDTRLLAGVAHRVIETRVDNVTLAGTLDDEGLLDVADRVRRVALNEIQQRELALLLPLLVETTEAHVGEVLEPLKVRDRDTAAVQQQVGQDDAVALVEEDLLGGRGRGAVGGLDDDLGLDAVGVAAVHLLLERRRHQNVARRLEERERLVGRHEGAAAEALEGLLLAPVAEERVNIEAGRVDDAAVPLDDARDLAAVLGKEVRRPVADVAEALHDDRLAGNAGAEAGLGEHLVVREELAQAVAHAETRGLGTAADTALRDGLAGDARRAVDVDRVELLERVLHPSHLTTSSTHIRSRLYQVPSGIDTTITIIMRDDQR